MFSIMLLIAAFSTGDIVCILVALAIVSFVWFCILGELNRYNTIAQKRNRRDIEHDIDAHMDYYYGDINWIHKGKL